MVHLLLMAMAMHDGERDIFPSPPARATGSLEHERNGVGLERDREGAHEQVWAVEGALRGQALFSLWRGAPHAQGLTTSVALAGLTCS